MIFLFAMWDDKLKLIESMQLSIYCIWLYCNWNDAGKYVEGSHGYWLKVSHGAWIWIEGEPWWICWKDRFLGGSKILTREKMYTQEKMCKQVWVDPPTFHTCWEVIIERHLYNLWLVVYHIGLVSSLDGIYRSPNYQQIDPRDSRLYRLLPWKWSVKPPVLAHFKIWNEIPAGQIGWKLQ